jgi:hypothetical protein
MSDLSDMDSLATVSTSSAQLDPEGESVSERILRKSYYSRFNDGSLTRRRSSSVS